MSIWIPLFLEESATLIRLTLTEPLSSWLWKGAVPGRLGWGDVAEPLVVGVFSLDTGAKGLGWFRILLCSMSRMVGHVSWLIQARRCELCSP